MRNLKFPGYKYQRYWPVLLLALTISLGVFFPARSMGLVMASGIPTQQVVEVAPLLCAKNHVISETVRGKVDTLGRSMNLDGEVDGNLFVPSTKMPPDRRMAVSVSVAGLRHQQYVGAEAGRSLNLAAVNWDNEDDTEQGSRAALVTPSPEDAKIRVGIKRLEPFVFIDGDGRPYGFSVDLWNAIAADLGMQYEWVLAGTVNELIANIQSGKIDVAIAGISMTPQRESLVDFTYPYFESGLQIMVRETPDADSVNLMNIFFSSVLLKMLGVGLILLFLMANLIWLIEVRSNPEMPKKYFSGLWDGLWWGLQMLIKQEYMHAGKPKSALKRLFVMVWMIFGIVLIAEFTATITTSQTVSLLRNSIESLSDLQGQRVLTVAGSTAEEFLTDQQVRHNTVERIEEAYKDLLDDQADAIVFDAPVLLYYAQNQGYGLVKVVGLIYQEENYGIALPTGSPLRKPINSALLSMHGSGRYEAIYAKWFGSTD